MRLNDFCEYINNPLANSKARVVVLPPGESWTALRHFYHGRGAVEVRLSNLVNERSWLPMPTEVFRRVREAMAAPLGGGNAVVLLGVPGYLSLLTDQNKLDAIALLRNWVDQVSGQEAVCFLRRGESVGMLKGIFVNPRYRQGKQLVEIDSESSISRLPLGRKEVTLVGEDLVSLIPEECDTFQKYLRYTEEYPSDDFHRRIVVASDGHEIAGLSAEVEQVVSLRDFARIFYDVEEVGLSESALRWLCEQAKKGPEGTLLGTLQKLVFPEGEVKQFALSVFERSKGAEREAILWLFKQVAPNGSYLEHVASQKEVEVSTFRSAYAASAATCLDSSDLYAEERRDAIFNAGVRNYRADIQHFIKRCRGESTARVAPWLNCGTGEEKAELLRRCADDGFISKAIKDAYPEVAAYLDEEMVFANEVVAEYFREYRELKLTGHVTQEFFEKARQAVPLNSVQKRDVIVQRYASDDDCALLVVDAMGAEWLPMLIAFAKQQNIGFDLIAVGKASLPTSTHFNRIPWADSSRQLPDIKRFDNIVHNGVEAHETHSAEVNLVAALSVIGDEVLPRVAEALGRFERVLVTADHGSSRLAMLAWKSEPKFAQTLCEDGVEISDWRYCKPLKKKQCPKGLEETLSGEFWVVRGYNRMAKKGGGMVLNCTAALHLRSDWSP